MGAKVAYIFWTASVKKQVKMVYERKPNIPTLDQVREVFRRNGGNDVMAEAFFNKYEALGWFLGNSPILNFVGIALNFIRNWQENDTNKSGTKTKNRNFQSGRAAGDGYY